MRLTLTGSFKRSLKRLSSDNLEDTLAALKLFQVTPDHPALNFEKLRNTAGYFTIRSNYSIRVLLRRTAADEYDVVAVGNHDYIYARLL